MNHYGMIGIFFVLTIVFPIGAIVTAWAMRPRYKKKPGEVKRMTYECGVDPKGRAWIRYRVNYFLYALIFLLFDVETIFLYPWAVRFQALGLFAFCEMLIFIAILALGLWYAWKEGALKWY